jgi:hypothetical protein
MPMSKGAKIAIGCVVAFVGVVFVTAAVMFGAVWWGANKVKEAAKDFVGEQEKIQKLQEQANANPFTPPDDRVVAEDRLVRFLNVRKKIYRVYEAHQAEFEVLKGKEPQNGVEAWGAARKGFAAINEARLVQAEALVEQKMSSDEYRYLVATVYQALVASEVQKGTGKNLTESVGSSMESAAEQAEAAAQQPNLPEEQKQKLLETAATMREQARAARAQAKDVDVPQANIELFRKYETDIKKYSMAGLEVIGL